MTKKPAPPTEYQECVALNHYLKLLLNQGKVLEYAHIVNELSLNRKKGQKPNLHYLAKRKAEGWRPGVPDYLIVLRKGIIYLEMKRKQGGTISPHQKNWIEAITQAGGRVRVCKGFDEAKEFIDEAIKSVLTS